MLWCGCQICLFSLSEKTVSVYAYSSTQGQLLQLNPSCSLGVLPQLPSKGLRSAEPIPPWDWTRKRDSHSKILRFIYSVLDFWQVITAHSGSGDGGPQLQKATTDPACTALILGRSGSLLTTMWADFFLDAKESALIYRWVIGDFRHILVFFVPFRTNS